MRRSTVLNLIPQLAFPAQAHGVVLLLKGIIGAGSVKVKDTIRSIDVKRNEVNRSKKSTGATTFSITTLSIEGLNTTLSIECL
jgi:hypothetical protein